MTGTAVAGQNAALTEMAMGYFRSRALCAAARSGVADALGDEERIGETISPLRAVPSPARCTGCCGPSPVSGWSLRLVRRALF